MTFTTYLNRSCRIADLVPGPLTTYSSPAWNALRLVEWAQVHGAAMWWSVEVVALVWILFSLADRLHAGLVYKSD